VGTDTRVVVFIKYPHEFFKLQSEEEEPRVDSATVKNQQHKKARKLTRHFAMAAMAACKKPQKLEAKKMC
jgi:hypothetical protein